uniref:Uncharacterized protein n=1 Tax=Aotus nancymaae TaxID=37293 RepID=A0A2K5F9S8_AOTNA
MAVAVRVYLQLKKKLEDEFPGRLDIVIRRGNSQLIHSKKVCCLKADGYVDTESKFLKLVAANQSRLGQG